jgi:hypothetical protein
MRQTITWQQKRQQLEQQQERQMRQQQERQQLELEQQEQRLLLFCRKRSKQRRPTKRRTKRIWSW